MSIKITYEQLIKKLIQIGFIKNRRSHGHLIMTHQQYDALVVLPYFRKKEQVPDVMLVFIRKILIGKGVLTLEEFNELVQSRK